MKKSILSLSVLLCTATTTLFAFTTPISQPEIKSEIKGEFSKLYATPLVVAITKGDIEIVKKFIEYGAEVNVKTNDKTPLMYASRSNKLEIVKYLIEKGADVKIKDQYGLNALDYAKLSNADDVVAYLETFKS